MQAKDNQVSEQQVSVTTIGANAAETDNNGEKDATMDVI